MVKDIFLSVVIPVYNEEENVKVLYERLTRECKKINREYEIIFVDDDSYDNTVSILSEFQAKDKSVKIIKLSKNHGHQLALSAGLDYSQGKYVITMDADLQHPPELIPKFLEEAQKGFEIVNGVKKYIEKSGSIKYLLSSCYYKILKAITRINVEEHSSDFRLYSRKAVEVINAARERERYLRGLAGWIGFKQTNIYHECPKRYAGKPKYTLTQSVRLASYAIFSFSAFPLRVTMFIGIGIVFLNIIYSLFSFIVWIKKQYIVPGYTSIVILLLFLFSWLFIAMGILGEYVLRIYEEVKKRPLYIIDWKKGFEDN